jgi:hypothetical protein
MQVPGFARARKCLNSFISCFPYLQPLSLMVHKHCLNIMTSESSGVHASIDVMQSSLRNVRHLSYCEAIE